MRKKNQTNPLKKIILILAGIGFLGSTITYALIGIFDNNTTTANVETNNQAIGVNSKLEAQAKSYEKILAREPNNPYVLSNLLQIRLQMQDYAGAIAPLETLVKLYPQDETLKAQLDLLKARVEQQRKE
ncbi:MAG: tetratricopeptide repeat protein [Cyanobacteria bacterium J083]|nr:MAG: tetratricopeptide repeat protein [Cyanobacteria bacterium J083]